MAKEHRDQTEMAGPAANFTLPPCHSIDNFRHMETSGEAPCPAYGSEPNDAQQ
jgi:hypothetical protein